MELNISEVTFTNVSQYRYMANGFQISFTIDYCRYTINVEEQRDGLYHPIDIYHVAVVSNCSFCKNDNSECQTLMNHKQELFHRLIEHPNIRLEWLYINHA